MPQSDATRDPYTITADARRVEVAGILARGLVRTVREARARVAKSAGIATGPGAVPVDSAAELRLSVAPDPAVMGLRPVRKESGWASGSKHRWMNCSA